MGYESLPVPINQLLLLNLLTSRAGHTAARRNTKLGNFSMSFTQRIISYMVRMVLSFDNTLSSKDKSNHSIPFSRPDFLGVKRTPSSGSRCHFNSTGKGFTSQIFLL